MTSVSTPISKDAQLAAIEQSGWGTPYKFFQPHNPVFWVYLFAMGAGAVSMVKYFATAIGPYTVAFTSGVVLFALYLVPWLLFLRRQNRYTAQPAGLLATGFLWGGIAATFWIAIWANGSLLTIWSKVLGPVAGNDWGAGLAAPLNEEWGKALGLIVLIGLAPRLVRSAYDGFIIGAFIGLGFQVFEDVLYAYNNALASFGAGQVGSTLFVFAVRSFTGLTSHALFSAIFCAGVMWILGRTPGERNVVRGLLACLFAMGMHFAWDDVAGISGGNTALEFVIPYVILMPLAVAGLFYVRRLAARTEQAWTRDLLGPEVEAGVVDPELLTAVSGRRKDRKHYREQLHSRAKARHLIEATGDLAHAIADARGTDTPRVEHARAELVRLRSTT
ncbi:PrsW family intramembrane metalloprotease [Cryptosporangium aurantiacum]|uniref:Membrane proteinase PrsW, cleaves anti-sigma factor RsiW, M82 family n=1 Tax=Cryptosporangium aurantiacum TaxID=134849 RepID=A0A1M7RET4_9ACTN|nr:PrsW family intramembrane metalloprotease [Cryptosporangium aurantiacum]SHN44691.1 Membrane proteinase PrsW, cleaves anti-sigma factor RsiW, M82 family [Cryptosporangium aurantiacum]